MREDGPDSLNVAMAATVALYELGNRMAAMAEPVLDLDDPRARRRRTSPPRRRQAELEELRVRYLGRKSELTQALRSIGELPPEERGTVGQAANAVRQALEDADRGSRSASSRTPSSSAAGRGPDRRDAARATRRRRPGTCT